MTDPGQPSLPTTATGSVEAPVEDVLEQSADLEPPAVAPVRDPESTEADAQEQAAPADDPAPPSVRAGDALPVEAEPADVAEQSAVVDLDDPDERR